ncbi:Flagellar M-ring protein [Dermatophilus congolensis]|uniref:Flagellar M-ring protein n=1 Tax=Dermatophilus congolensis TaxID=1863 RepID=A0A239VU45_9MICO|nr:flagellar basal-body MS-ring/collar protein FliF [Dermatophilus congolensis]SNV25791.1 Flagellar M-ring protein [Dermatophilus congolensis]
MKNEKIQHVVTRIKGTFNDFTRGQKAVTIIAALVAIAGAVVFFMWVSKPTMVPLYTTPVSDTDAAAIQSKLTSSGVKYTLSGNTFQVPQDQRDKVRLDLAAENLPSKTDASQGYGLVEKAPVTASDEQQRILIQRATEGELASAIQKIDTVQEATVHLALPKEDVFVRQKTNPTASVLVKPKANQTVSASQVESIVHLVSASVPKLTPGNVTVTDSQGRLLSAQGTLSASAGEARLAQQQATSMALQTKIQAMLDKAVGMGNSTTTVNTDMNYDNSKVETNEYLQPKPGAPALQNDNTRETLTGSGQTPIGGVLGPDNIPVPNGNAGNSRQNWEKTTTKEVQPYGTRRTLTDQATGGVSRLNVAVMLDQRTTGAINQQQIQQLVATAAGINPQRGDVITVSKVPFDQTAAQAQAQADAAAAEQKRMDDLWALAKNIGLLLLLLLALLIGFLSTRTRKREVEIEESESIDTPTLPELPGGRGALGELEGSPAAYDLDGDELPVVEATPVDPQSIARAAAREEISGLVEDSPEEVARLLRGWMAERK